MHNKQKIFNWAYLLLLTFGFLLVSKYRISMTRPKPRVTKRFQPRTLEELLFGRVAKRTERKRKVVFKFEDKAHLAVFSDGIKIYVPAGSIHPPTKLRILMQDYLGRKGRFYRSGGNSNLYRVEEGKRRTTKYLLKFFLGGRSPFIELRHMLGLRKALAKYPTYKVPKIELVIDSGHMGVHGFMVMEFVDHPTVQDLMDKYQKARDPRSQKALDTLKGQFNLLKERIQMNPKLKELVTDFHEGNILAKQRRDGVFEFTLIDQ